METSLQVHVLSQCESLHAPVGCNTSMPAFTRASATPIDELNDTLLNMRMRWL